MRSVKSSYVFAVLVFTVLTVAPDSSCAPIGDAILDPVTVVFELFTRRNPVDPQVLQLGNATLLQQSYFNSSLPVKMFAHGINGQPSQGYSNRDEYLKREDCNYFSIDWAFQSSNGNDTFVVDNGIPISGATAGAFIVFLANETGVPLSAFHLIGFSDGAHVVGNAGEKVLTYNSGTLPRISGLDPGNPREGFPLNTPDNRLDTTDAEFVDIMHTSLATLIPTGHVDFYVNGGVRPQPGCPPITESDRGCSHGRSVDLFAESVNSAIGFRAKYCDSYANFLTGACDQSTTAYMGDPLSPDARGTFYLSTNAESPFAQG